MSDNILAAVAADTTDSDCVDWLELTAFFDEYGLARIDAIVGAKKIQEETEGDDIGEEDAAEDQLRDNIEAEINLRSKSLGECYPFELTGDGEQLRLKPKEDRHGAVFYLFCLILSHATRSAILKKPPIGAFLDHARKKHFQTFSTLAVAGEVEGPSISLGWPRASGLSIYQVVQRAVEHSATGTARTDPVYTANPAAKDGGIDVLAWKPAADRPPPSYFVFGQAASGHGWPEKSSKDEKDDFVRDYYDVGPQCDHRHITVCPFRVDDDELHRKSLRHGMILDRTRAPKKAFEGCVLASRGELVDEYGFAWRVAYWVSRYRRETIAA